MKYWYCHAAESCADPISLTKTMQFIRICVIDRRLFTVLLNSSILQFRIGSFVRGSKKAILCLIGKVWSAKWCHSFVRKLSLNSLSEFQSLKRNSRKCFPDSWNGQILAMCALPNRFFICNLCTKIAGRNGVYFSKRTAFLEYWYFVQTAVREIVDDASFWS